MKCFRLGIRALLGLCLILSSHEIWAQDTSAWYTIRPGDTASEISEQYLGSIRYMAKITKALDDQHNGAMKIGANIRVPGLKIERPQAGAPIQSYRVQPGDTLSQISTRLYGSQFFQYRILNANASIENPDQIHVGTLLNYYPSEAYRALSVGKEQGLSEESLGAEVKAETEVEVETENENETETAELFEATAAQSQDVVRRFSLSQSQPGFRSNKNSDSNDRDEYTEAAATKLEISRAIAKGGALRLEQRRQLLEEALRLAPHNLEVALEYFSLAPEDNFEWKQKAAQKLIEIDSSFKTSPKIKALLEAKR